MPIVANQFTWLSVRQTNITSPSIKPKATTMNTLTENEKKKTEKEKTSGYTIFSSVAMTIGQLVINSMGK